MVAGANNKPMVQLQVTVAGQTKLYAAEEISAMVLTKMKQISEEYLGETIYYLHIYINILATFCNYCNNIYNEARRALRLLVIAY